jgi:hypothetical protein
VLFPEIVPGAMVRSLYETLGFAVWLYPTPHRAVSTSNGERFYDGIVISRLDDAENVARSADGALIYVLCAKTMKLGWVSIYEVIAT